MEFFFQNSLTIRTSTLLSTKVIVSPFFHHKSVRRTKCKHSFSELSMPRLPDISKTVRIQTLSNVRHTVTKPKIVIESQHLIT